MAVVNLKSTFITNRDAVPAVRTDAFVSGGSKKSAQGWVSAANGDSANSIYRLCSVPSNARVDTVKFQCDALGTSAAVHIGVYYPEFIPVGAGLDASNAGAAISDAFFASALAVSSAVALEEVTNQSGSNTIDKQEMPLWEALGLSTDPGIDLDVCVTVDVAIAAAGKLGVKVDFAA